MRKPLHHVFPDIHIPELPQDLSNATDLYLWERNLEARLESKGILISKVYVLDSQTRTVAVDLVEFATGEEFRVFV